MFKASFPLLPPSADLETKPVLKKLAVAHRELASLGGFSHAIPNRYILINSLTLQEAKDSSEIENIVTTHDEIYRAAALPNATVSLQAKEVRDYAAALLEGFHAIQRTGLLTINDLCAVQQHLEHNTAGIRSQAGTTLKNLATGEVVHTPPQSRDEIIPLLTNLERAINDDSFWPDIDPLVKMAVLHYQFETIHPFYGGNGRTGRILNVLYLVLRNLLDSPVLYLSRHIIARKALYYRLLDRVRRYSEWEPYLLFMLDAVIETSRMGTRTIAQIRDAYAHTKDFIRSHFKFYSRDLVEALFLYPYTRIATLQKHLGISRPTATAYLEKLSAPDASLLRKFTLNRNVFFVNQPLFDILSSPSSSEAM